MENIVKALSRAAMMMLTPRVWGLVWRPSVISIALWVALGSGVWFFFGEYLLMWFNDLHNRLPAGDAWWNNTLSWLLQGGLWLGLGFFWLLLVVLSSMFLISVFGMGHINRAVAERYFPTLQVKVKGGLSTWRSIKHTTLWTFWFAFFWIISTPAYLFAGLGAVIQTGVMARYNQKVFVLDALAEHADVLEYDAISQAHNRQLFILGLIITLMGALPTFIWMGSIIGVVLLPFTAILSVLTFTALFTFCGLSYSCYCLQALSDYRVKGLQ